MVNSQEGLFFIPVDLIDNRCGGLYPIISLIIMIVMY